MPTKQLRFESVNLGGAITLYLYLGPPAYGSFADLTTEPWRKIEIPATKTGEYGMPVTWDGKFKFRATRVNGKAMEPEPKMPVEFGQKTILRPAEKGGSDEASACRFKFSEPVYGDKDDSRAPPIAINETSHSVDFSLDVVTYDENKKASAHYRVVWENVAPDMCVNWQPKDTLQPVLYAYVKSQHQAGGSGSKSQGNGPDSHTTKAIWEQNLLDLGGDTTILISKDASSQKFVAKARATDKKEEPITVRGEPAVLPPQGGPRK